MREYIDMHLHTIFSDGNYSVKQMIRMLEDKRVRTFSFTDHDSIDSCRYMESFDTEQLSDPFFNYIRGVEISSKMNEIDMHILGYNFKFTDNIDKLLSRIRELRRAKMLALIEAIRQTHGVHIAPEDIHNQMLKPGVVGKANVITLLHENGCVGTNSEINKKYIHGIKTGICIDADIEESISVIREAHGIPVLAHPKEIENKYGININEFIRDLVDRGIEGIEVYNSLHTLSDIKRFLETAKKYNLLISGGSDYHGGFIKKDVGISECSKEKTKLKELSLVSRINEIGIAA